MWKWKPWNSYCVCFCRSGAFFFQILLMHATLKIAKLLTCGFFLQISDVYFNCDEPKIPHFWSAMASRGTCNFTTFVSLKLSSGLVLNPRFRFSFQEIFFAYISILLYAKNISWNENLNMDS
jgi:hypothetical protein